MAPSVGPSSAQKLSGVVVTLTEPPWQTCGTIVTSAVEVANTCTPARCRVRSKSAEVPNTPTYTGVSTGVSARTVVSVVARASGWVLTQPITARSTSSATAYVVIRQPRRDAVTAREPAPAGSGVTDVMAGG